MEPVQIAILILRILISIYGQNYDVESDVFLLTERSRENIVFVGDFKGVKKVIICDDPLYDYCGIERKQQIILLGQTQVLIHLNPHPFEVGESFYVHTLDKKGKPTHPVGYRIRMGFFTNRIYPLI